MQISHGRSSTPPSNGATGLPREIDDPPAGRCAFVLDRHLTRLGGGAEHAHRQTTGRARHRGDFGTVDAQRAPRRRSARAGDTTASPFERDEERIGGP